MSTTQKRPRPGQGIEGAKGEAVVCNAFMSLPGPVVNLESPRLWRAFRKFNRNFKRIARLQEENARLLEAMRRAQGVPGVAA